MVEDWGSLINLDCGPELAFKKIVFLIAIMFWLRVLWAVLPMLCKEARSVFMVGETLKIPWYWRYFFSRAIALFKENKEKMMQALGLSFNAFVVIKADSALGTFAAGIPFYPPVVVYVFLLLMELLMLALANLADRKRNWSLEAGSGGFNVKLDPMDVVFDTARERNLHRSVTRILWQIPELAYYYKNKNRSLERLLYYLIKRHIRDISLPAPIDIKLIPGEPAEQIQSLLSAADIHRSEIEPVIIPSESGSVVVYRVLLVGENYYYIQAQMRRATLNLEEFFAGVDLMVDYARRLWEDLEAELGTEEEMTGEQGVSAVESENQIC